ncbi:MAG: hypothetical protein E7272_01970 [Pseudobutyrivibrio ruminis]|uniref:Polysaccharide pyruvyl transferase domain-containing protein n=1 Tax=Pseudobutyrivibrio ruminis TaxID=46206 RepID=A0A927YPP4_9FIRM|nr:hypothetical protein [Pseudobutyrivibrio ruminis]
MWNHIKVIKFIKDHIPFFLRIIIIRLLVLVQCMYYRLFPKNKQWSGEKRIFVLLSTDYSNLGDHAMTYAHIKLLNDNFRDYKVHEVLVGDTIKFLSSIRKIIGPNDIITFKGGGNIGIEYFREELIRRKVINTFVNNRLIVFPQTVYFPDTWRGNKELKKTVEVFNNHPDLHLFLRDRKSYELMNRYVKRNVYLTPDIVFSLGRIEVDNKKSHGALMCLRRDVEGIYTDDDKEKIYRILRKKFNNDVIVSDTIKDYKIEVKDRKKELISIWKMIANAELIITDRLHGMIFAALLGTPCIVLNTYNHKLRGQYEWIKHLNYIYCVDMDENIINDTVDTAMKTNVIRMRTDEFSRYFDLIIKCIRE